MKKRIAILISGRGSNMVSLAEACRTPGYPAEVALVLSNRPDAAGLERARAAGLRTLVIDHKPFASRDAFDDAVDRALADAGAEIVCHAGFMRIQGDAFARRWLGRQLNIHPSLLPSFKGLHPHKQALDAGVRISGCTVHFVTPDLDSGPIVAQAAVPVLPGDDVAVLEARILSAEHTLYPLALKLVATGEITIAGIAATPASPVNQQAPLFSPAP